MGTERPVGHSVHHQAIDRVAEGMVVTGRADDGTIEATESVDGWVVSVQWHPEDDAHERSEQQGLFDAFVAACSDSTRRRRPGRPTLDRSTAWLRRRPACR